MTNTPKNSSAPSDARRRAEEALAKYDTPLTVPRCGVCGKEMDCHYSGPEGTRWYCGNYFGDREAREHFKRSGFHLQRPDSAPVLADALRALLAEQEGG